MRPTKGVRHLERCPSLTRRCVALPHPDLRNAAAYVAGSASALHTPGDGYELSEHPKTGHIPRDDAEPHGAAFDAAAT